MNYKTTRSLIESGDVIAMTNNSWDSWSDLEVQFVRMMTRSEFSHVGIAWCIADRIMIIEAVVPRIRIFPLSKELPFYWIPMKRELSKEAEEYALSLVGERYSKMEAIFSYFGKEKDNDKWQCAEVVRSILKKNGIDLDGMATPTSVVKEAMELGNPLILVTGDEEKDA